MFTTLTSVDHIAYNAEVFGRWNGQCLKDNVMPAFCVSVGRCSEGVKIEVLVGKGVDQEFVEMIIENLYKAVKAKTFTILKAQ
jgi:hypothetical protein